MNLYILRHGQSLANRDHYYAGQSEVPLSDLGLAQAAAASAYLTTYRFDRIYCSDLMRTRQTLAGAMPGVCTDDVIFRSDLREINTGTLTGTFAKDITDPVVREGAKINDYRPVGGECEEDVQVRTATFLRELAALAEAEAAGGEKAPENVLLVSHYGIVTAALSLVVGVTVHRSLVDLGNCALVSFTYKDGKWKLSGWGLTGNSEAKSDAP